MRILTPMATAVAEKLKVRGETIAVSESSTGGLISASLLSIPGASQYFMGGGVIYTATSRTQLLGIDIDNYPGMRSASPDYAALGAATIRESHGTTWGLAETGATGPTGNRYGDAAGHSCIAVAGPNPQALTIETGQSDREGNMWRFTEEALALLFKALNGAA